MFKKLRALGKRQIVVFGVETHVCVLQTVMDLTANSDTWVYVVIDGVSSRREEDKNTALRRMEANGCILVSTEMVLFEWLKTAGTEEFKDLQKLIK